MNVTLVSKPIFVSLCLICFCEVAGAEMLGTAFSYNGRLTSGGEPANGRYDFEFSLYDALTNGTQIGAAVTRTDVPVSDGIFAVFLDFGSSAFSGEARWLAVTVRTNSGAEFTPLNPRQLIGAAPYALYAPNSALAGAAASTAPDSVSSESIRNAAVTESKLAPGTVVRSLNGITDHVLLQGGSNVVVGAQGNVLTIGAKVAAWDLGGNAGTLAGFHFIGTTDPQPLELKVNGQRAMRVEPTTNCPNLIGGYGLNSVDTNAVGVTIAGGGGKGAENYVPQAPYYQYAASYATIGGGLGHLNFSPCGTISGGCRNLLTSLSIWDEPDHTSLFGTIGGGATNTIMGNLYGGDFTTIGGGRENFINGSDYATVGGGSGHYMDSLSSYGTIAGGYSNMLWYGYDNAIGGGNKNFVSCWAGTIGGGESNRISGGTHGFSFTTIGGGSQNWVQNASSATIAGGFGNWVYNAGNAAIAGGSANLVEAECGAIGGGQSNWVNGAYGVVPGGFDNSATNYSFAAGYRAKALNTGSFVWAAGNTNDYPSLVDDRVHIYAGNGVRVENGGQAPDGSGLRWLVLASTVQGRMINVFNGAYLSEGGMWVDASDRDLKENFKPVDARAVLECVSALPVTSWNYRSEDKSIRHLGPVAQDFSGAFGLGADDKHISPLDSSGVALAAIQGLHQIVKDQEAQIQALKQELSELKGVVNQLASTSKPGGL